MGHLRDAGYQHQDYGSHGTSVVFPVVKASHFHCRGVEFDPWSGNLGFHMPCGQKNDNNCGQHLSSTSCVSGLVAGSASLIPVPFVQGEVLARLPL